MPQRSGFYSVGPAVARLAQQLQLPPDPVIALIPAYNEERFIGSLVLATRPYVDLVVVVDDGSADQTSVYVLDHA